MANVWPKLKSWTSSANCYIHSEYNSLTAADIKKTSSGVSLLFVLLDNLTASRAITVEITRARDTQQTMWLMLPRLIELVAFRR